MNYEDFLARVRDDLEKRLTASFEGVRVEVARTEKLQNQSYTGIRIGLPDLDVSPMINPTNLFEEVNRGRTFDSVVDELADMAGDALATADTLKKLNLTNYEEMKSRLTVQLVSKAANRELLAQLPHTDILDMAEVYRITFNRDHRGEMSSIVTNQMLNVMGVSKEELHRDAMTYAPLTHPAQIRSLGEVMRGMLGADEFGTWDPARGESVPMYVATTVESINGAGVIAYPGFMEEAKKQLGGDFYVLPSSIHEVLLIPVREAPDYRELLHMVTEINAAIVSPEEKLTDNVYRYSSKERVFETAADYENRDRKPSVLAALNDKKTESREKAPAPARTAAKAVATL